MSSALAVTEVVPEITLGQSTITISVAASNADEFTVSAPYHQLPEDSVTLLNWVLDAPPNFRFDTPGIMFLGDQPNMARFAEQAKEISVVWVNSPHVASRSFPYRVMLLRTNLGDGTTTPITHDPVVHNDPPSLE
jgi:hypothetical protein